MDFEIRPAKQHSRGKLRREREEYFRLVKLGYGNKEASKLVGINPRTGREWRNGRPEGRRKRPRSPAHIAQVISGASSRFLSETERIHIADRVREKATVRAIAAELGRSPSTISREIRRNRTVLPNGQSYYRPYAAQRRAEARRLRPKPGRISQNPELRNFIQDCLTKRWSPEQICHALRRSFPDRPEMHVVHETIYQALYVQGRGEIRRELARALRTGRTMRKPHRQSNKRQPRYTTPMVMISDRPAEAADRAVPGHSLSTSPDHAPEFAMPEARAPATAGTRRREPGAQLSVTSAASSGPRWAGTWPASCTNWRDWMLYILRNAPSAMPISSANEPRSVTRPPSST